MLNPSTKMKLKLKNITNFSNWETLTEEKQKETVMRLQDKFFLRQLSKMIGNGILRVGTTDTIVPERIRAPKISP